MHKQKRVFAKCAAVGLKVSDLCVVTRSQSELLSCLKPKPAAVAAPCLMWCSCVRCLSWPEGKIWNWTKVNFLSARKDSACIWYCYLSTVPLLSPVFILIVRTADWPEFKYRWICPVGEPLVWITLFSRAAGGFEHFFFSSLLCPNTASRDMSRLTWPVAARRCYNSSAVFSLPLAVQTVILFNNRGGGRSDFYELHVSYIGTRVEQLTVLSRTESDC